MLALGLHRMGRCRGCGGDLRVTTAAQNEERFEPGLPLQCHRCVAADRSHEAYKDHPNPHSLIHVIPTKPRR